MSTAQKQQVMLIDDDQDLLEEIADTLELEGPQCGDLCPRRFSIAPHHQPV